MSDRVVSFIKIRSFSQPGGKLGAAFRAHRKLKIAAPKSILKLKQILTPQESEAPLEQSQQSSVQLSAWPQMMLERPKMRVLSKLRVGKSQTNLKLDNTEQRPTEHKRQTTECQDFRRLLAGRISKIPESGVRTKRSRVKFNPIIRIYEFNE